VTNANQERKEECVQSTRQKYTQQPIKLLDKHQLISSMSKQGDCYDNAAMDNWNYSLKVEAAG
jgi:hypothetical protein